MSQKTRFQSSVKHSLIRSFRWWPHLAKEFVFRNADVLEELRAEALSSFKAAERIDEVWGRSNAK